LSEAGFAQIRVVRVSSDCRRGLWGCEKCA
jgi:hypothetical protein